MKTLSFLSILSLSVLLSLGAFSCAKANSAQWHPDSDGIGAWFDAASKKIAVLKPSSYEEGVYELMRFSLDPKENSISYINFSKTEADSYSCPDDPSLTLNIKGPSLSFSGSYTDGSPFQENYLGVNKAFVSKKAVEAEAKLKALNAKKDLSMMDQQEAWVLEMIASSLREIQLPK